jgi:hypothetical protein
MKYFCCDKLRRNAITGTALNGIDFLEVLDRDATVDADRQRFLFVHFVNDIAPALTAENLCIAGGERIQDIVVLDAIVGAAPDTNVLTVEVEQPGDFSLYRLSIVTAPDNLEPPGGIDPMLASIEFSFKVECPTDLDCKPRRDCPPATRTAPEIDYLTKDYASFRRLMLDRMAATIPQWKQRNAADLGVTLVELLAYLADHLSYQQDAVATEGYLGTARSRISVRRHARLVDYFIGDGKNARTWAQIEVRTDVLKGNPLDPPAIEVGTPLTTRLPGEPVALDDNDRLLARADTVFETVHALEELYADHVEISFYTWGDERCCLPAGATQATLLGPLPNLSAGQVLIFEEVLGPRSGEKADADPTRRHAVRLIEVVDTDSGGDPLTDPIPGGPAIVEIRWHDEDRLPFAFCISSRTDPEHGSELVTDVSVARGNVVLVDHGRTIAEEDLGAVRSPTLFRARTTGDDRCDLADRDPVQPRFRPVLDERPLTQALGYEAQTVGRDGELYWTSARAALHTTLDNVTPEVLLLDSDTEIWEPRRDLLNSDEDAKHFVVETECDGTAVLRFGDDEHGERPNVGIAFSATYRVGNGSAGNIGADALAHIVSTVGEITAVRNPLPATGGVEPESIEDVRKNAPEAFRIQERAVTAADYAEVTERDDDVQRAAATFRWTGSWHTVFVTVDRVGGFDVDTAFETEIRDHIEQYRMAGYDLEVDGPRFVPLDIEMDVCVDPEHFRGDVRNALTEVLSNGTLRNGRLGVFHPDNLTFGQTVNLSPIYAAAHAVQGVESVHISKFQRQGVDDPGPLEKGRIELDRLEIARLDNDRNFPERGVLTINVGGGK